MTKLLQRIDVTLRSFYVFNSKFGKTDGEEHKKILYYYPDDIETNTKIKDVGLSEAIIAFISNFTEKTNDCQSLHTQKTTQVFFQAEPDYWMVLVLNVPKEIRSKDGIEVAEYRGGEVHEHIYRSILEECYLMFRLMHGSFQLNLESYMQGSKDNKKEDIDETVRLQLQQKLTTFYDKYVTSLKLPVCNIMDIRRSLQYLVLDKHIFLDAHNFVNTLHAMFPKIFESVLLYKNHVVCGGKIDHLDLYCLHKYIFEEEILSKMSLNESTSGPTTTVLSRSDSTISESYRGGAFITSLIQQSDNCNTTLNAPSLPKLYLGQGQSISSNYLIIYRALDAVLCLLLNSDEILPNQEFYDELHAFMGPKLSNISEEIAKSKLLNSAKTSANGNKPTVSLPANVACASQSTDATVPKYLFIDERSFKHISNISVDRKRAQLSQGSLPSSVLQLIVDLEEQDRANIAFSHSSPYEESLLKTTNDFWIVKRCRNWRKYYVIIFNNKSTLLDVTAEAMRIFDQELENNIFFDK